MSHEITMVFDKQIAVEKVTLPDMPRYESYNQWRQRAAEHLAKFIIEHSLMTHHSRYDIAGGYEHETFTMLVARPEGKLP